MRNGTESFGIDTSGADLRHRDPAILSWTDHSRGAGAVSRPPSPVLSAHNLLELALEFRVVMLPACEVRGHAAGDHARPAARPRARKEMAVEVQRDQREDLLAAFLPETLFLMNALSSSLSTHQLDSDAVDEPRSTSSHSLMPRSMRS